MELAGSVERHLLPMLHGVEYGFALCVVLFLGDDPVVKQRLDLAQSLGDITA